MWESYTFALRLTIYLALSGLISAAFGLLICQRESLKTKLNLSFQQSLKKYYRLSLVLFLAVSLGYFWIRVGAFAEEGFAGLLDTLMISILYDSGLGDALNYQLLAVLFATLFYRVNHFSSHFWIKLVLLISLLVSIALSFSFTGHTADFNLIEKSLLSLHILIAFLWLGSLYPLYKLVRLEQPDSVKIALERFGYYASYTVPLLLIAGVCLVYLITDFSLTLLVTYWGGFLLAKLVTVVAILALAAWHKYRLVPDFLAPSGSVKMAKSLTWEIYLGLGILSFSAVLSTLVSP
jgi:putative copper resistance protein D